MIGSAKKSALFFVYFLSSIDLSFSNFGPNFYCKKYIISINKKKIIKLCWWDVIFSVWITILKFFLIR